MWLKGLPEEFCGDGYRRNFDFAYTGHEENAFRDMRCGFPRHLAEDGTAGTKELVQCL